MLHIRFTWHGFETQRVQLDTAPPNPLDLGRHESCSRVGWLPACRRATNPMLHRMHIMFQLTDSIFTIITTADDQGEQIKLFASAFQTTIKEVTDAVCARIDAEARDGHIVVLKETLSRYSIPKTVAGLAMKAANLDCTLLVTFKDDKAHITLIDPKAPKANRKKGSRRRYFVDGKPLFDSYKGIKDAMVKLGGFDNVVPAIGPGNAHKVDSNRWGPNTSMNAWQALQALGTDSQKARITRTNG
jgi:hypothetical protein